MENKQILLTDRSSSSESGIVNKGAYYLWIKRLCDILFAASVLFITAPLIILSIVVVKLTSNGPAFYRAKRAGIGGRPFHMLKIRTMYIDTDTPDRRVTAAQDERITLVGNLLRKFKIDELPQLWNVLRGEMSIIGPRPEDYNIAKRYFTAKQRRILIVRPGIASPADVRWYPDLTYHDPPCNGISMQEWYLERHLPLQLAEGLQYVDQQCFLLDLKVLMQTVFCVLVRSWLRPKRQHLPHLYIDSK